MIHVIIIDIKHYAKSMTTNSIKVHRVKFKTLHETFQIVNWELKTLRIPVQVQYGLGFSYWAKWTHKNSI